MPLTELQCRASMPTAKIRKLSDVGVQLGSLLGGSRHWRVAYRFAGRRSTGAAV